MQDDSPWIFARVLQYIYYNQFTGDPDFGTFMALSLTDIVRGGHRNNGAQVSIQDDPIMKVRREIRENTANIAVFLLADKYCMEMLEEHTICRLSCPEMSCKDLVDVAKDHIKHSSELLKDWFAERIEYAYKGVSAEEDENAKIIQGWLAADPKLCFMVMEHWHARLRLDEDDDDDDDA